MSTLALAAQHGVTGCDVMVHAGLLALLAWAILALQFSRLETLRAWREIGAWRTHHTHVLRQQNEWFKVRWQRTFGMVPVRGGVLEQRPAKGVELRDGAGRLEDTWPDLGLPAEARAADTVRTGPPPGCRASEPPAAPRAAGAAGGDTIELTEADLCGLTCELACEQCEPAEAEPVSGERPSCPPLSGCVSR